MSMTTTNQDFLTAEEVGQLVRSDGYLVERMYASWLIDSIGYRKGQLIFTVEEAHRWKSWYLKNCSKYHGSFLGLSSKILAGFFLASASIALLLGATGVWMQGIPVLLILCLVLPAFFVVPPPRPRLGWRFKQIRFAVMGVAAGLTVADPVLSLFGFGGSGTWEVGSRMLLCALLSLALDYPEIRSEEGPMVRRPALYLFMMSGCGVLAVLASESVLGVHLGFVPSIIAGVLLFAPVGLVQLMRRYDAHAFSIALPAAGFFSWEYALIAFFVTGGVLVVIHLARQYLDALMKDDSLPELMMR